MLQHAAREINAALAAAGEPVEGATCEPWNP
jgi:hypothetical protein